MQNSFFRRIDKPLLILYAIFLILGWVCVYEASYVKSQTSILDIDYRSGMQFIWICVSIVAAIVILNTKPLFFYTWSYVIYVAVVVLLIVTLFVAPNIKGSHSWLVIGGFSIQPAEFAKFATALAIAYFYSLQNLHTISVRRKILVTILIIALPMGIILLQKEAGSALVFLAFMLMLYREGLSPMVILVGFLSVVVFIITIRFASDTEIFYTEHLGKLISTNIILLIAAIIYELYALHNTKIRIIHILGIVLGLYAIAIVLNIFLIKIDLLYVALLAALLMLGLLVKVFIDSGRKIYLLIAVFIISFIVYSFSTEFIFEKVLEPHQKIRIETLLGLKEDPKGAEWNTNQSKIAISSGGLWGKGFLKGTQTKLKFVPEQDTDFIFCTIAEEWGFVGSIVVVSMFFIFIYRILFLSERQSNIFARVYGYSVAGIFIFHVIINIGMVVGIVPVIGIPLPFFSYGGSSLLAFTILLFIFIKLDMGNKVNI